MLHLHRRIFLQEVAGRVFCGCNLIEARSDLLLLALLD